MAGHVLLCCLARLPEGGGINRPRGGSDPSLRAPSLNADQRNLITRMLRSAEHCAHRTSVVDGRVSSPINVISVTGLFTIMSVQPSQTIALWVTY